MATLKLEVGKYYKTRDGRKVGPMKNDWRSGGDYCWHTTSGDCRGALWKEDGEPFAGAQLGHCLIAEWTDAPTGPVRTVTRREVVPGVYGKVQIGAPCNIGISVFMNHVFTTEQLRAAIATLTEIADALEEQQ